MSRQTIRHEGDDAERSFLRLVRNSRQSPDPKQGDVVVLIDGNWRYVEIKQCQSNTINQVRAIKFIPLIIYSPGSTEPWVVVPPHEVVRLVAAKSRGQHTEIPFECANLSLNHLADDLRCGDADLEREVLEAVKEGDSFAAVRDAMTELHDELVRLSERTKQEVIEAFRQKGND
jgi:hypothetical protein